MDVIRFSAALVFTVTASFAQITGSSSAPFYSAASIVHAATQTVEALAPNTIGTIYGANLAFDTRAVASSDVVGGLLPTTLDGVSVFVGNLPASLFFISPGQINFLVPYSLTAGTVTLWLARQGVAGPVVSIQLNIAAPGMFPWNGNLAIATHLNGSLVSAASPAAPSEIVIVYAAGLGRVSPDTTSGKIVPSAAVISALSQFQVLLAGVPCPAANILYAGLAPGYAGLYQINLKLPAVLPPNPEIRIAIGAYVSPAQIVLAAQ